MLQRCYNPRNPRFKDWGGRGIIVCDSWKASFDTFLADMGLRPNGLTIGRKDNNGPYCPSNCKWATTAEQAANKKRGPSRFFPVGGEMLCVNDIAARIGKRPDRVRGSLGNGYNIQEIAMGLDHDRRQSDLNPLWPYPAESQVDRKNFIARWRRLGMTLEQLGQLLGVTRERIRQLETWQPKERKLLAVKIKHSIFPARGGRPQILLPCAFCSAEFPKTKLTHHMVSCPSRPQVNPTPCVQDGAIV